MIKAKWQWNNDKQNWECSACGREAFRLSMICPLCGAEMCIPEVNDDHAYEESCFVPNTLGEEGH